MVHELYNQDKIDILFVGASHCNRSINYKIIEEKTGKKIFVACSVGQRPDGSLALIKEAIKLYDIEEIYFETSETIAEKMGTIKKRSQMTATYAVSDYMRPSLNKIIYLLNASSPKHYINSFWRAKRFWISLFDFERSAAIIEKKSMKKYRDYSYYFANNRNDLYSYEGKGFLANKKAIQDHRYYTSDKNTFKDININKISEDWKAKVLEIVDLCNKKNIKLTLFDAPVSNFMLANRGNYDDYIDFLKQFVKDKKLTYVEFNLLTEKVFPYKQTSFSDTNHLNENGALDFSNVLSEYINGNVTEDYFEASIKEKLASSKPYYYGISYSDDSDRKIRSLSLVSNRKDYFEYKIELVNDVGDVILIQDFDVNNEVEIPLNRMYKVYVTFREKGSDSEGIRCLYE